MICEKDFEAGARNMSTRSIFSIEEVYQSIKEEKNLTESHLGVPGNSKGCGGIIDIALMIPESVVLFVAPLGCARHVATHSWQRDGRVFALALDEAEVVTGTHLNTIEQAILEIYNDCRNKPKLLTICGSCIDRLMASDFEMVAERLYGQMPGRILVIWMDPVVGRKEHCQVRCWDKVYSMWRTGEKKNLSVNLIGRLYPPAQNSELPQLLKKAGVENIKHMAECETLNEFYEMGNASLNILGSNLGEKAAKKLQKTKGIPYIKCQPTLSVEKVYNMYRQLEDILKIKICDEEIYRFTKKEVEQFKKERKNNPVHMAIGEAYASHEDAFSMAKEIAELGISVDWIYSDGKFSGKSEQITWLYENQKNAKVLLLSHPGSRKMMLDPPEVDVAWGMNEKWFLKKKNNHWIDVESRPIDCDYASVLWFINVVENELKRRKDK